LKEEESKMDTVLEGQRMKDVIQLLWDISSEFSPEGDGVGQHVPAVRSFGERAEALLGSWFDNFEFGGSFPPDEDVVIGFSSETSAALQNMHEASNTLAQLLVRDFGVFEDREGSH
jgi:hypothetical protein